MLLLLHHVDVGISAWVYLCLVLSLSWLCTVRSLSVAA